MKQLLFIHGGMTFNNHEEYINYLRTRTIRIVNDPHWNEKFLDEELYDFQIIKPKMPRKENSVYEEWKIHFERHTEFIEDNVTLVGFSLGGVFLAKYLSENKYPKKINSLHLIAPPFDGSMPEEDLAGGFELSDDLSLIEEQCSNVHLYFSKDDFIVPIQHASLYKEKLPNSNFHIFESKNGHFLTPEFPELIKNIKSS